MKSLSKKCKYALHALYRLTYDYGKGPVLISKLSTQEKIPHKFLEVILWELRQQGIVESKVGKRGGYQLAVSPSSVTIGRVIRLIDGPLAPLPCASETAFRQCDECADISKCGTRMVIKEVRDAMAAILDHTTLADVCRRMSDAEAQDQEREALMYYI